MTALPANARLCHRCAEHFIGRACPKCPPALASAPQASAGCGSTYGITTDARKATVFPPAAPVCRCSLRTQLVGDGCEVCNPDLAAEIAAPRAVDVPRLVLRLKGQVRGGKNNMGRTKTGKSYPKKLFADWRAEAIRQIKTQFSGEPIARPCNVRLDYVAEDRRRRDFPAICDALWHALERAGVVTDDTLLWPAQSSRSYDKAAPGVTITFLD